LVHEQAQQTLRVAEPTKLRDNMELENHVALSIVVPCYNEAHALPLLRDRLLPVLNSLGLNWEVVFVDDGSADSTGDQLAAMHRGNPRFKILAFSRNFGHQAAISAGLAYASGDVVAIMDADLQDPPEILSTCLEKVRAGYDVVYAVRRKRKENVFKRSAYTVFYRLLKFTAEIDIPLDSGDFCVMTRRVVTILTRMPERNVFVRGLRAWAGFRQIGVPYEREARAAGETKYPFKKLLGLAMDGVFAFSTLPLRLATFLGFFAVGLSVVAGLFILSWRVFGFRFMGQTAHELPGWTAVVGAALFFGGIQLLILGVMGEYLGRIYAEVKQRPRWVVREALGIQTQPGSPEGRIQTRDRHLD
jgi:polyisoprenyl-phosphate glycosyltransferase